MRAPLVDRNVVGRATSAEARSTSASRQSPLIARVDEAREIAEMAVCLILLNTSGKSDRKTFIRIAG
jgi:hypothetical protein